MNVGQVRLCRAQSFSIGTVYVTVAKDDKSMYCLQAVCVTCYS